MTTEISVMYGSEKVKTTVSGTCYANIGSKQLNCLPSQKERMMLSAMELRLVKLETVMVLMSAGSDAMAESSRRSRLVPTPTVMIWIPSIRVAIA